MHRIYAINKRKRWLRRREIGRARGSRDGCMFVLEDGWTASSPAYSTSTTPPPAVIRHCAEFLPSAPHKFLKILNNGKKDSAFDGAANGNASPDRALIEPAVGVLYICVCVALSLRVGQSALLLLRTETREKEDQKSRSYFTCSAKTLVACPSVHMTPHQGITVNTVS